MTSAVPPAHHAPLPEWALLGLVIFLCTVLGPDWLCDCKVLKKRVSECHNHTESYTASIRWNADLTLESSAKTRDKISIQRFHSIGLPS